MKRIVFAFLFMMLPLFVFGEGNEKKFQEYLNNNKVDFRKTTNLITDSVAKNNQIFLICENHAYRFNTEIEIKLIKELKEKTDFRYFLAEFDWAVAHILNEYLRTGDKVILDNYLNKMRGTFFWSKEYFGLLDEIRELNKKYDRKMEFLGVDIPMQPEYTYKELNDILNRYQVHNSFLDSVRGSKKEESLSSIPVSYLKDSIDPSSFSEEDAFLYHYHLDNLVQSDLANNAAEEGMWDYVRDSLIFSNYKKLISFYGLENEKMVGIWGREHGYQEVSSMAYPFSFRLKRAFHTNIYSMALFYIDSEMMFPTCFLPDFLMRPKDKKRLYRIVDFGNDDNVNSIKKPGIDHFRQVTKGPSITWFDLDTKGSPYRECSHLIVGPSSSKAVTTDFFQVAILVRKSKANHPYGRNRL